MNVAAATSSAKTIPKTKTIDVPQAMKNVLMFLQRDPRNYKKFGIYWWAVKDQLKQAGYTRHDIYLLGRYRDDAQAARIPPGDVQTTLRRAFSEFRFNSGFPRWSGAVEDDDGEIITIWDDDAGI